MIITASIAKIHSKLKYMSVKKEMPLFYVHSATTNTTDFSREE